MKKHAPAQHILVVNTGSSTIKQALFEAGPAGMQELSRAELEWDATTQWPGSIDVALDADGRTVDAIGHRVVHGGVDFIAPVRITADVEQKLDALESLAPLHNGPALSVIRAFRRARPQTPAFAVFDTAFHAARAAESTRYALPSALAEAHGLRRYGFHGLAHASLVDSLAAKQAIAVDDVDAVTLQLGAGCSACAVRSGRSVETSMGFTPLEGLIMATRCGDVDPAIAVHLMRAGYGADRIEQVFTRESGLLALSGTGDMRRIIEATAAEEPNASLALRMFCRRIVMTCGAYFTLLGGKGALVFGGGIGANAPFIRHEVARGMAAWNVEIDAGRNERNEPGLISRSGSRPVFSFRTDEERMIAREVASLL
jgi:acetate kinase